MTTPPRPLPSPEELAAAYQDLARIHAEHLAHTDAGQATRRMSNLKSLWDAG